MTARRFSKQQSWLLLSKAPNLGITNLLRALDIFGSPEAIFDADFLALKSAKIFKQATIDWLQNPNLSTIEKDLAWLERDNAHLLTLHDDNYPKRLKAINGPPPILYALGDVDLLKTPQIAIVGSRNPTPSGVEYAQLFARQLTQYGLSIVSGMALGIDGKAHIATLEAKGGTIAVCGTGLDKVYPARHRNLAKQIATNGVLLSEFAIGTPPIANNFPRRNRVISGLSMGTLVIEATLKSGSLITARYAVEQGREVFAVPSAIHNPQAKGPHALIKQGAKLVESVDDIIEELSLTPAMLAQSGEQQKVSKNRNEDTNISDNALDSTNNLNILRYLSYDVKGIDELVVSSKLSVEEVSEQLILLELANRVERVAGAGFVLRRQHD